jgi:hypothetical protein
MEADRDLLCRRRAGPGCSINQQHIGLMFGMVITPMIFFWFSYYRGVLSKLSCPAKKLCLSTRWWCERRHAHPVPQFHTDIGCAHCAGFLCVLLLVVGLRQFRNAVGEILCSGGAPGGSA